MFRFPLATLTLALVVGGCAGANPPETASPPPSRAVASPQPESFLAWRESFRPKATAAGISPATFDTAFAGVGVNARRVRYRFGSSPSFDTSQTLTV